MIVVADAGPLIHLAAIGQLELIRRLSSEVEVKAATWIRVVPVARHETLDALLAGGLHRGESEAIAVALEHRGSWLPWRDEASATSWR